MNKNLYANRISYFSKELEKLKRKNRNTGLLRLFVFILAICLIILFFELSIKASILLGCLFIISFLFLVHKSFKYKYKIKFTKELIKINNSEINALTGDISNFDTGNEFIDNSHNYSTDLDIFGEKSIYQNMNRTCTEGGAEKLANALKNPLETATEIRNRQEESKELSKLLDWRQNFQATGNISMKSDNFFSSQISVFQPNKEIKENDYKFRNSILEWLQSQPEFYEKKLLKPILYIIPLLSLILIFLLILGILPAPILLIYAITNLSFYIFQKKKIDKIEIQVGKQIDILQRYENLLQLIENKSFKSQGLNTKKSKLKTNNISACGELKKLKIIIKYLENRNNILFAFIANALFQWDIQCALRLEQWRLKNKNSLPKWLDTIYEFDFLSSIANFSYNNPEFATPEIIDTKFYFAMEEGGHPLINSEKRVNNNIIIDNYGKILLITGANMAGKSTFLRTIGVNMVLSMSGAVVCAKNFSLSPIKLHTSIRTNDSIQNNESYFFAELKRLQSITEEMKKEDGLFVIIDEMLRGTNSSDKHNGSQALIEQLIRYKTVGLLATHDIALGNLAQKHPQNIKNYRFEVEIENDELIFDYTLKTGISKNLNATFLMKKMGIID